MYFVCGSLSIYFTCVFLVITENNLFSLLGLYYPIIDFNEVEMGIYLSEKALFIEAVRADIEV